MRNIVIVDNKNNSATLIPTTGTKDLYSWVLFCRDKKLDIFFLGEKNRKFHGPLAFCVCDTPYRVEATLVGDTYIHKNVTGMIHKNNQYYLVEEGKLILSHNGFDITIEDSLSY